MPRLANPLQLAHAAVGELEPGSGDEILDGARGQDLAGLGERANASRQVDRDAAYVLADQLDLAAVQSDADVEADRPGRVCDRTGAPDRSCRPVEDRQEPVA